MYSVEEFDKSKKAELARRLKTEKERNHQLESVTIKRTPSGFWDVTRERYSSGESGTFKTLVGALDYITCIYDENGQLKAGRGLSMEGEK